MNEPAPIHNYIKQLKNWAVDKKKKKMRSTRKRKEPIKAKSHSTHSSSEANLSFFPLPRPIFICLGTDDDDDGGLDGFSLCHLSGEAPRQRERKRSSDVIKIAVCACLVLWRNEGVN